MLKSINKGHWLENEIDLYLKKQLQREYKPRNHFSPSSISDCIRENYYIMIGLAPDKEMEPIVSRIFDVGTDAHNRFYRYFEQLGILHSKEIPIRYESPPLVAVADCIIKPKNVDKLLLGELKSKGGRSEYNSFDKLDKPEKGHVIQWNIYSRILEIPEGFILYEDKATQRIKIFDMIIDYDLVGGIFDMLLQVQECVHKDKVPPKPGRCSNQYCRHKSRCRTDGK